MGCRQERFLVLIALCQTFVIFMLYTYSDTGLYGINPPIISKPYFHQRTKWKTFTSNTKGLSSNLEFSKLCIGGHLKKMPPMCGLDGCLQTLTASPKQARAMPVSVRANIDTIHGWMSPIHVDVVQMMSEMQWSYGIYGSVGEIGVYEGRYTAVLAYFTAVDQGERLFVCDIFGNQEHMKLKTEDARKDIFEENMKMVGFSLYTNDERRRIRIWEDSSMFLTKAFYRQMALPTFRFFSIDGSHHGPFVLNDLRHVVCVLRHGGIISSDDILNGGWPDVLTTYQHFVQIFGGNIVKPLLLVAGKLYSCDASWHSVFMMYIGTHGGQFSKITDTRFGDSFTYFTDELAYL